MWFVLFFFFLIFISVLFFCLNHGRKTKSILCTAVVLSLLCLCTVDGFGWFYWTINGKDLMLVCIVPVYLNCKYFWRSHMYPSPVHWTSWGKLFCCLLSCNSHLSGVVDNSRTRLYWSFLVSPLFIFIFVAVTYFKIMSPVGWYICLSQL